MWANVERFDGGVIRVFDNAAKYGEPYLYSMTFKTLEPGLIEFVGATQAPTLGQLRAIVAELRSQGIRVQRVRRDGAHPGVKVFE